MKRYPDGGHAVAVGDPFNGMTFYGPFASDLEAFEWADENLRGDEAWYTVVLESPSSV